MSPVYDTGPDAKTDAETDADAEMDAVLAQMPTRSQNDTL
jgi:hypothetical protein